MKKTLVVSYTPRHDSNTRKLLEAFLSASSSISDIEHLDLVDHPPPLLLKNNLNTLLKRNFMEMELSDDEIQSIRAHDILTKQVLHSDRIIVAFPMYNFSLPATVKAWIDSIIQKDQTFKLNDDGNYEGLCHGKRALILLTAGADYREPPFKSMNFASPLMEYCFNFMGIEAETIAAFGLNHYINDIEDIVAHAQQKIIRYVENDDK